MSKKGFMGRISDLVKNNKGLAAGVTMLGAVAATKMNSQDENISLQDYATDYAATHVVDGVDNTIDTETIEVSKSQIYRAYIDEHGISKEEMDELIQKPRHELTNEERSIINIYHNAKQTHEDNIVHFMRNECTNQEMTEQEKYDALQDRKLELSNLLGDKYDHEEEYERQGPRQYCAGTRNENGIVQTALDHALEGNTSQSAHLLMSSLVQDDPDGLAKIISAHEHARQDVIEGEIKYFEEQLIERGAIDKDKVLDSQEVKITCFKEAYDPHGNAAAKLGDGCQHMTLDDDDGMSL